MKRVWITEAGSEIGLYLAEQLLQQGHVVALTSLEETAVKVLAKRWPERVLLLLGDVRDDLQRECMLRCMDSVWGALDQVLLQAESSEPESLALAEQIRKAAWPLLSCSKQGDFVIVPNHALAEAEWRVARAVLAEPFVPRDSANDDGVSIRHIFNLRPAF